MDRHIDNYLDDLFYNVPPSVRASELKEDLLTDMSVQFEELLNEGKTEDQAYRLVFNNLGDVDQMLEDVLPRDEFLQEVNHYRIRNARNTAIGIVLYIVGAAFLVGLGGYGNYIENEDNYGIIGLVILLLFSAIATGLIVYTNMSTPFQYKNQDQKSDKDLPHLNSKHQRIFDNILTVYWIIITVIYLFISFKTMLWGIT